MISPSADFDDQAAHPAGVRPVALVTGAARRLGAEIAAQLAQAGYTVAVHHHASSPQDTLMRIQALQGQAQAFKADLDDEVACEALVPQVVAQMGRLDLLVNNASRFEFDSADNLSFASMQSHWQANTAAPIVLSRALHRHLSARGAQGCVVNLLDQKLWNPNPDYFSYTLSKAALECATQLLARAYAPRLRVCGVAPGVTLPTEGVMDNATFDAAHRMTVLQRSSTPADVARAVVFLAQSPAITGTTILVDGGQHLSAQARDVAFLADPKS